MKNILLYITRFLCSISVFILSLICITLLIFNKSSILSLVNNTNYVDKISTTIRETMEDNTISSLLPYSVLDNIYTREDISRCLTTFITSFYKTSTEVDVSFLKENLSNNISAYLKENNITNSFKENIDSYVNSMASIYEDEITLYGYLDSFKPYTSFMMEILPFIFGLLLILCIGLLLILKYVFKENRIAYIFITPFILNTFIAVSLFIRINISDLFLFQSAFSLILKTLIKKVIVYLLLFGAILLLEGIIVNLINVKYHEKHHV